MVNRPLHYAARKPGGQADADGRPSAAIPSIYCGLAAIAAGGAIYYLLHLSGVLRGPLTGVEGGVFVATGLAAVCVCLPLSGLAMMLALMAWPERRVRPAAVVCAWLLSLGLVLFWIYAFTQVTTR